MRIQIALVNRFQRKIWSFFSLRPERFALLLPRLHRFRCALTLHNQTGSILCFDYQAEALREVFGAQVNITSIDFAAYERMMLHQ